MDENDGQEAGAALWLDEEQQAAWRAGGELCMRLPATLESDLQRTAGLSVFEYEVLAPLWSPTFGPFSYPHSLREPTRRCHGSPT